MTRVAFVDTETTGLSPYRHDLWEIAVIERTVYDGDVTGWEPDVEHVFHIRPDLQRADPTALRINRFYERTAALDTWQPGIPGQGWQPAREVASRLARMLAGAHIVGSNPAFDVAFLERLLFVHGEASTWDYHLVDVRALAAGYLHARSHTPRPKLSEPSQSLASALGVPPLADSVKHTALGDARWARDVYDRVTSEQDVAS